VRDYIHIMRIRILASSILAALLAALPAAAEQARSFTTLSYATTVAGLTVMLTEADVEISARGYRIDIATRTAGTFGLLIRGETRSLSQGLWAGDMIAPQRYAVAGTWRGIQRRTLMDYATGQPMTANGSQYRLPCNVAPSTRSAPPPCSHGAPPSPRPARARRAPSTAAGCSR
jgi:hypothetical protein